MRRRKKATSIASKVGEGLLRSINVVFDVEFPDRISHFRPTSKSARVLEALLGLRPEKAFLITAPYGSGKSLVGAYAAQIIENRRGSREVIESIANRLASVRPTAAARINARVRSKLSRGLSLALHGSQPDLSAALAAAANASLRRAREGRGRGRPKRIKPHANAVETLAEIITAAERGGFDAVLIVWDEFGRHLESLLAQGRAAELHELQTIAELASRKSSVPLTIGLMTHRGFAQYATAAPQTVRTEWAKVEGRFEAIQYIDDSKEMYRLVAEAIQERRLLSPDAIDRAWLAKCNKAARSAGVFSDLTAAEVSRLLEMAYPLHPVALFALPRIASRVSQNERTIFGFLNQESFAQPVNLTQVYDFFADSMRGDSGAGGSYRQYIETETAIRRASSEDETVVLKTACLLGLGLSGERGHVSKDMLDLAVSHSKTQADSEAAIQGLIDRKLLLYRRHSNDVSVWHGTDVDLRGALESEKERHRSAFSLVEFLRRELPAPVWRPVQFNDEFLIKRYFAGRYTTTQQLQVAAEQPNATLRNRAGADGLILFALAENVVEQERAQQLAQIGDFGAGIVIAIPQREVAIGEPALEVACIEQMLRNVELVGRDPLVEVELRQLLDDARGYLHRAVSKLISPGENGPRFWHEGVQFQPTSAAELRSKLSSVTSTIYSATPKINNEMINRRKVSAIVANARKKLEMAILERTGIEGLGIGGNFPDASIFRTVLLGTGLYRADTGGGWRFAYPDELTNIGLRTVWENLRKFFQESALVSEKPFTQLIEQLFAPPVGLRPGVLPVLLASAFRAFPAAISLRRDGEYVNDILPTVVEAICKSPADFTLEVLSPTSRQDGILNAVGKVFSDCDPNVTGQQDKVRRTFDSLRNWIASLPPIAIQTNEISESSAAFRNSLTTQRDPVQLLFVDIERVLKGVATNNVSAELASLRTQLEAVVDTVRLAASDVVRRALDVGLDRKSTSLGEVCQRWTKCFSIPELQRAGGAQAVAFITRLEQHYDTDVLLLDSLASQLVGQPTARWSDTSLLQFDRALSEIVRAVEDEAVRLATSGKASDVIRNNLARLIEARIHGLYENLCQLQGVRQAHESLVGVIEAPAKRKDRGNNSRSTG